VTRACWFSFPALYSLLSFISASSVVTTASHTAIFQLCLPLHCLLLLPLSWLYIAILASQLRSKLEIGKEGWRGGSSGKSTDCSSRGPEFKSQQPHGGSQPSVMGSAVSEDSYSVLIYIKKINKPFFKKGMDPHPTIFF
jgi:hypothetical protein